jgi:hypothetical protein
MFVVKYGLLAPFSSENRADGMHHWLAS